MTIKVDCQWDNWGECMNLKCNGDGLSRSKGTGMRHRKIKIAAKLKGKECIGKDSEACEAPCPGTKMSSYIDLNSLIY